MINTTIRLRASQFRLLDDRGMKSLTACAAREIDPGLIDRQIVHYGNYDPFMEFDIQLNQILPSMGYRTLYIEPHVAGKLLAPETTSEALLENAFWEITLNDDGTLRLLDKASGLIYDRALEKKRARMMAMSTTTRLHGKSGDSLPRRASMRLR